MFPYIPNAKLGKSADTASGIRKQSNVYEYQTKLDPDQDIHDCKNYFADQENQDDHNIQADHKGCKSLKLTR